MLVLFRYIERWLHQHIFKVGWLLTNNYQTTTVLYYIIFLPGILLHESTLWLAAGLLNVRADRAIQFPQRQEIGELRLNFIRLSAQTGLVRHSLIALAPLVAGIAALCSITVYVFNWEATAFIAAPGKIDDLASAINSLSKTADFWLWFYLAFTVANTMSPTPPRKLSARHKSALAITIALLILIAWRVGGEIDRSIPPGIESLLGSLALVMLQIIFINIVVVLALGALEALIERVTGKSATFTDGKMITMTRQEAQERKAIRAQERQSARQEQPAQKSVEVIVSIYDLKLPIPGPPGREPVSRSAVTVVNAQDGASDSSVVAKSTAEPKSSPKLPTVELKHGAAPTDISDAAPAPQDERTQAHVTRQPVRTDASRDGTIAYENTPFSRPFVQGDSGRDADGDVPDNEAEQPTDGFFPRPFTMRTRSSGDPGAVGKPPSDLAAEKSRDAAGKSSERKPRTYVNRSRPSPKPSDRVQSEADNATRADNEELTYEPFDDGEGYADDEDIYDDTLSSS